MTMYRGDPFIAGGQIDESNDTNVAERLNLKSEIYPPIWEHKRPMTPFFSWPYFMYTITLQNVKNKPKIIYLNFPD